MITVIDYGMGNSGSIMNILRRIGAEAVLTSSVDDIARADQLVLPGVGAFEKGLERLNLRGTVPVLKQRVLGEVVPILGMCLGMQLLGQGSEEGTSAGLGWLNARSIRFRFDGITPQPRIPHMGWNIITLNKA